MRHLICGLRDFHHRSTILLLTKEVEKKQFVLVRCRKHMGSTSYPYTCITINKILNSAKPHNKSQFTASLESRIMALQLGNFLWKCRNTMTLILIIVKLCQQFTEDYQKNTGLRGWVLRLRI